MTNKKKAPVPRPKKIVSNILSEKVVITKITKDMTGEELDKQIDSALDEIFGKEDEANEVKQVMADKKNLTAKEQADNVYAGQLMAHFGETPESAEEWKEHSIMADKKKNKPTVKKPPAKKTEPVEAKITESKRRENIKASLSSMERQYPGITEQYYHFEETELPSCSHCGSNDTASVQVGIVGRTIYLAGISKKLILVPNVSDRKGKYFCNACGKFFD